MNTESLIRMLAADRHAGPRLPVPVLVLAGLVPALAVAALGLWLSLGFRPDLAQTLVTPGPALRYVLAGALGLVALRLVIVLARPEGRALARLWPVAGVGLLAAGLLVAATVATPPEARAMALFGKTAVTCLVTIPLLSVLPVAAILFALRQGATTAPGLAGLMAGLAGGGFAAAVYAMHCTEDSPMFYVTWYGLAICLVAGLSGLAGRRLLRW